MACWALGAAAEPAAQRESMEHSLSAGLKGLSVNGPKTSKGRLERARYPVNLNPNNPTLSSFWSRAGRRSARAPSEAARSKRETPRTKQTPLQAVAAR